MSELLQSHNRPPRFINLRRKIGAIAFGGISLFGIFTGQHDIHTLAHQTAEPSELARVHHEEAKVSAEHSNPNDPQYYASNGIAVDFGKLAQEAEGTVSNGFVDATAISLGILGLTTIGLVAVARSSSNAYYAAQ